MKKVLLAGALLLCSLATWADDDDRQKVEVKKLPHLALSNLKSYYPDVEVVEAYTSSKKVKNEYTVRLANSVKIVFDKHGQWSEVEANQGEIPRQMVPGKILTYMSQNGITARVVEMKKDKKGYYEIELDDDTELYFDNQFKFVKRDRD